ncbi:DUF1467 family protein [Rhodopila sp.]|jgi:predicted secreted protein|uniref:DUF1467 family protein n=1 Tax=Rhodopila sp. TaxID=2480087 RepID=UPI002C64973E|nr:DUF1467 family protein [Rhodopila sp.]HVZ07692.1 DUF1467 family protein [Rhodopila sp.]
MNWFTGCMLFIIIWWTALFAVLPLRTRPMDRPDEVSGWRGTPENPRLVMKVIVTTLVTSVLWLGIYAVVRSDYISFRHGVLAMHDADGL